MLFDCIEPVDYSCAFRGKDNVANIPTVPS